MVKDTNPYTIIIYSSTLIAASNDYSIVNAHPIITVLKALYQFAAIYNLYISKARKFYLGKFCCRVVGNEKTYLVSIPQYS